MVSDIAFTKYDLFSVPVAYYKNFLPLDLAYSIKDYILRVKVTECRKHHAFTGEAYSLHEVNNEDNLTNIIQEITETVAGCSKLLNNIKDCVNYFTSNINYPNCVLGNSWFNIQKPGSLLHRHSHTSAKGGELLSGVLYINVDDKSSSITFENPNPYSNTDPGNIFQYSFKPNIGDLILFPAWLIHLSKELNMSDERIVISFNVV